jgi:DNA-binding GntR family transcriptional regulator
MAPYVTKNDWVYKKIKSEILNGMLRPGERIVVSEVAKRLEVSPMPVREALARLQQDELVHAIPHIGAKVAPFNVRKFLEITAIRTELETMAAKLATKFLTKDQIELLSSIVIQMEQKAKENDNAGYEPLNRKFHEEVYASCQNQQLHELIMSLWEKTEISRSIFARLTNHATVSVEEHKQWLEAIKERNEEKVAAIVHRHKERAFERLSKVLETEDFISYQ